MYNTFVLLLHGLGAHTESLFGIEKYLNHKGYKNTYKLSYLVDILNLTDCLEHINSELEKIIPKTKKIIVIGQSMGGVYGSLLHTKGWNIELLITIGSPLKGAYLVKYLKKTLPTMIQNYLYKPVYDDLIMLLDNPIIEPPHDYHCFSMAWPFSEFDGCVYIEEAYLNPKKHTHLNISDHRFIFGNPRLWNHIYNRLRENN